MKFSLLSFVTSVFHCSVVTFVVLTAALPELVLGFFLHFVNTVHSKMTVFLIELKKPSMVMA